MQAGQWKLYDLQQSTELLKFGVGFAHISGACHKCGGYRCIACFVELDDWIKQFKPMEIGRT